MFVVVCGDWELCGRDVVIEVIDVVVRYVDDWVKDDVFF